MTLPAMFSGGPFDGQEHEASAQSVMHVAGRLRHIYVKVDGEAAYEWDGPTGACTDCWSDETIDGDDGREYCPACGFVEPTRACHRCAWPMQFVSQRGELTVRDADGRVTVIHDDASRGHWECTNPACASIEDMPLRCPVCGSGDVEESPALRFRCADGHRFHFNRGLQPMV
jgi:hypothetical protein